MSNETAKFIGATWNLHWTWADSDKGLFVVRPSELGWITRRAIKRKTNVFITATVIQWEDSLLVHVCFRSRTRSSWLLYFRPLVFQDVGRRKVCSSPHGTDQMKPSDGSVCVVWANHYVLQNATTHMKDTQRAISPGILEKKCTSRWQTSA